MRTGGNHSRNQTAGKREEEWEGKDRGATAVGSSEIVLLTDMREIQTQYSEKKNTHTADINKSR